MVLVESYNSVLRFIKEKGLSAVLNVDMQNIDNITNLTVKHTFMFGRCKYHRAYRYTNISKIAIKL